MGEGTTWSTASATCEKEGGHLVAIHSEAENSALLVLADGGKTWIGLSRSVSPTFACVCLLVICVYISLITHLMPPGTQYHTQYGGIMTVADPGGGG